MNDLAGASHPSCLHLGDGFEVLEALPEASVDALITDPNYNITRLPFDQRPVDWPRWWDLVHRAVKKTGIIACFASERFSLDLAQSNRPYYSYRLIWEKERPTGHLNAHWRPLPIHEDILIFSRHIAKSTYNPQFTDGEAYTRGASARRGRRGEHYGHEYELEEKHNPGRRHPTTVLRFARDRARLHPTQKPLALMRWLVATYSNPGDHVLDPFMGSGSTGLACRELGRRFTGVEIDPVYHARAAQRLHTAEETP